MTKLTDKDEAILKLAEKDIQRILLRIEGALNCIVDHVEVDTRNYANCKTAIFVKRGMKV